MPSPTTVTEFLDLVRQSGVLSNQQLASFLRDRGGAQALPRDPSRLAGLLVKADILTSFQAEQFLRGRWRGFTIGKYTVLQSIGSGGMGDVYLCEHSVLRSRVAIKVLPPAKAADPLTLQRFLREARILAALKHPNLVRAHDVGQDGQLYFLVMEYMAGRSLQDLVTTGGPPPIEQAANYVCQAARGLQYFHEAKLVHRDIKPANILVNGQGHVKILDMGLARFFQGTDEALTEQFDDRSVLGTADYLSPEQARNSSAVDIRTDIYSLGCTFYFLLAGKPPFADGTVAQKLIWHQMKAPRPIRELRPEVPEKMAAVLSQMLAKDPAQRYPAPGDVADALAQWGPPLPASPPAPVLPDDEPFASLLDEEESASLEETPRPPLPTARGNGIQVQFPASEGSTRTDLRAPQPQASIPRSPVKPTFRKRRWIIAAGALLILAGGGLLRWFIIRGPDSASRPRSAMTQPTASAKSAPVSLLVTRSERDNTYRTIRGALAQAKPGDRIVVLDDRIEETLQLVDGQLGKAVRIEAGAPDGKRVVWQAPADWKDRPLVELANVAGLRLEGFLFDGQDRVDHLVALSGSCPGLTLSKVEFQGFKRSAVRLTGCSGIDASPVRLERLRFCGGPSSEAAVSFEGAAAQVNRHVEIRDCRFEGPVSSALRLAGPVDRVVCMRNRFFQSMAGVRYLKSDPPHAVHLNVYRNTFYDVPQPLSFETLPLADPRNQLLVQNNLFARAKELIRIDGLRTEPAKTPARWIWFNEPNGDPGKDAPRGHRFFRRTFVASARPMAPATLNIACDDAFIVWLNGREVGKGQLSATNRVMAAFDVSNYLRPEKNVLAIQGTNLQGPAGLLAHLTFRSESGAERTLGTDDTWRSATTGPAGWQQPEFNDLGWKPARVLAPYNRAAASWNHFTWESLVRDQTKGRLWPLIPNASGNVCCKGTRLHTSLASLDVQAVGDAAVLAINPEDDAHFLRYPRTHALARAAPGNTPVGVPPLD